MQHTTAPGGRVRGEGWDDMAYSELIKSFGRIRAYMRSFYVYGFGRRGEVGGKSARGYDDERRRIESWLQDYMTFRQDAHGRRFFLSVDSRAVPHNPLYRAFRTKSFTDRDIMLHFHLLDILAGSGGMPIFDIMEALTERLNQFQAEEYPDESTVRRKLGEYEKLGLVTRRKRGREVLYRRSEDLVDLDSWREALDFFSEAAPLGVIGDYCRERLEEAPSLFRFKHHYILNALDGEILLALVEAIDERRGVQLTMGRRKAAVVPLKLYISAQTGRQYLLARTNWSGEFAFFRLDTIDGVKPGQPETLTADLEERLRDFMGKVWGVSRGSAGELTRLEMTVFAGEDEPFIPARLEREKRCGRVEQIDERHWRFTAEVYDALELLPWVRTFIGRITELKCDDPRIVERYNDDLAAMARLYGGDGDALP